MDVSGEGFGCLNFIAPKLTPWTTREVPAVALGIIEKGLTWEDLLQIRLIS
jgi:hypothetical protein